MAAFVGLDSDGGAPLFKRRLDQSEVTEIPGTKGARVPFFSPENGKWIAFWADGKLKKTMILGGSPITLCDATDLLGGSWGDDGDLGAVLRTAGPLSRIASDGGKPTALSNVGEGRDISTVAPDAPAGNGAC